MLKHAVGTRESIVESFDLFFFPISLTAVVYACLGDYVFAFWNIVHRRLNKHLCRFWKACYLSMNTLVFAVLHVALISTCGTSEPCKDKPLENRFCVAALALSVLIHGVATLLDRVAIPFLNLYEKHAYASTFFDRVVHACAVCVGWMCVAEEETLGVVLLLALTSLRALSYVEWIADPYLILLKLYTFGHTFLAVYDQCPCKSKGLPVAVLGTMFVL